MKSKWLILAGAILLLGGCTTSYEHYYQLDSKFMERRQFETRQFTVNKADDLLIASTQALQDMGYNISESSAGLGLLIASKEREASTRGERIAGHVADIAMSVLVGICTREYRYSHTPQDVSQQIYVMVAINRVAAKRYQARVTFARIVTNDEGNKRVQELRDDELYRGFFERLDKSLYLTKNNL